ncbi:P2Y purinoceptor 3-like [Microcaecilia unicolor]|uniref:P2Y purinoceptor 3-like n=1 Tax=Microcaecilia unicolor TaxID=1415580 RepID=A0A6P7Z2I4_9AMPH|nr:P2Y purinoceptor 3-like [Microcaecilia unicolor]
MKDMKDSVLNATSSALCPLNENYKHILLPLVYSLVFLLGLPLNGAVLWLACRRTKDWTCSTIYLVNLSLADFLYVCSLPLLIVSYAKQDCWPFGELLCRLERFLFYTNLYSSILFLTCISVHRFLGVCYPMRSLLFRTKKLAIFATAITWILVTIQILPTFLYARTGVINSSIVCYDLTSPNNFGNYFAYGVTLTVTGFLVPFCIMALCCGLMIRTLIHTDEASGMDTSLRSRAVRTILLLFVLFAISFLPFHITRTVYLFVRVYRVGDCSLLHRVSIAYKIWRPLVGCNSCFNPLLHFLIGDKNKTRRLHELHKNKVGPSPKGQ